jgi:hypothetical protein
MQTYTDGRPEGHLRSREVSLIAAGHRCGNIGFRQMARIQNLKNNKSREAGRGVDRKRTASEDAVSGIRSKYLI